jgi:hypothetical protein
MLIALVCACGGGGGPQKQVPVPPQQPPVVPPDYVGYWTGKWGQMVLRESNGRVTGVYGHDEGTVTGAMNGNTFVGWWCEKPSRQPTKDAGDLELTFGAGPDGKKIDGKWRYGAEGAWKEDWDLAWNPGEPPPELIARFNDPSAFCEKPTPVAP